MAYLGSQWIQSRVSMMELPAHLPAAYENVVKLLMQNMSEIQLEDAVSRAMEVFRRYIHSLNCRYPRISINQESSFAAALEYYGCTATGVEVSEQSLCRKYRVSETRLRNALEKFRPYTEDPA